MPDGPAASIARSTRSSSSLQVKGPWLERASSKSARASSLCGRMPLASSGMAYRKVFSLNTMPRTGDTSPGIICMNSILTSSQPALMDDQHVGFRAHKPSSRHACDSVRKCASAGNPRCAARAKKLTDGRIARASGAYMRCRWGPGVCACASNLDAPRSARYAPRCEAARPCDIRVVRVFGLAASVSRGLRNQSPAVHRFCRASLKTHLRTHATGSASQAAQALWRSRAAWGHGI